MKKGVFRSLILAMHSAFICGFAHAQAELPEVSLVGVPTVREGVAVSIQVKASSASGIASFEIEETDLPSGYALLADTDASAEVSLRRVTAPALAARNMVEESDYRVVLLATDSKMRQRRFSFSINVATRQEVLNAITRSAHAYWNQKVTINRAGQVFYGFSGSQTVIDPQHPEDRFYGSDSGFIPEPHVFHEHEDDAGHSSVGFALVKGYQATGNKFLLRSAKALGDTLLSMQADAGCGGWWYDTGVIGYDRREGSPTYRQTIDFGRWVNYFPWGGHGNVTTDVQNLCSFDGVSWIPALYLLRLYQATPPEDPDRGRYLEGAKALADAIAGFKDVQDASQGFAPYDIGGIPQIWPYGLMKDRGGVDSNSHYPDSIPHNVMPTLNDGAMGNALFFLIEFWKEARSNPSLNGNTYLSAIRLNVDYLIHVFRLNANQLTGRGAWGSQYWVNDGSSRAGKVTWGRTLEPPGIGQFAERAEDVLLQWSSLEEDQSRKHEIEDVLLKFMLFFKYDAPPVNSRQEWRDAIAGYVQPYVLDYDAGNINTWYWWLWYNHDPLALDRFGSSVPLLSFVASDDNYQAYYGADALTPGHNHNDHYPMVRNNGLSSKISTTLIEDGNLPARVDLLHDADDTHNYWLRYYFGLDADVRLFRGWEGNASRTMSALDALDIVTGFFGTSSYARGDKTYLVVQDFTFQTQMRQLAFGVTALTGEAADWDGDGFPDAAELEVGSDRYDSESTPFAFNRAPVLSSVGDRTGRVGELLQFSLAAHDPDGDALSFSAVNLPAGAILDPLTGSFSWTPGSGQAGTHHNISFVVSDGKLWDSEPISILVNLSDTKAPAAPSKLRVRKVSVKKLLLSWKDNSDNEKGFRVEQKAKRRSRFKGVKMLPPNRTKVFLRRRSSRFISYLRLSAFNDAGSSYSRIIRVR